MKKYKLFFAFVAIVSVIGICTGLGGLSQPVRAIVIDSSDINLETTCDVAGDASFTGMLPLPPDTYDVYVRLPTPGQVADVRLFGQLNRDGAECQKIGSVKANGEQWSLVGSWSAVDVEAQTILQVASAALSSTLGANRPSVMVISKTYPTCVPVLECIVMIDGQEGFVRPIGTLPNQDSLHIVRPIDVKEDVIKNVTYYVDKEPAYTTKTLEAFDMRYVAFSNQQLARVIEYESGQRVVLNEEMPEGFNDNFLNFLFRVVQSNPRALISAGIIGAIVLIGSIALAIVHAIRRRRIWRLDHGFAHEEYVIVTDVDRQKAFMNTRRQAVIKKVVMGSLAFTAFVSVIVLTNTFVIQIYKVDGRSMEMTYKDGTQLLINKVPISWAQLAGHAYTPERGQVVIVRQVFGITDDIQSAEKAGDYLIKRVVGLPGERVVVAGDVITVYNTSYPGGFDPDKDSSWQATKQAETAAIALDVTLGKDEIFISGDNRPESIDSRFNGPILTKQIVGIAN